MVENCELFYALIVKKNHRMVENCELFYALIVKKQHRMDEHKRQIYYNENNSGKNKTHTNFISSFSL